MPSELHVIDSDGSGAYRDVVDYAVGILELGMYLFV